MNSTRTALLVIGTAALLLSGCNIGAPLGPTATATLSSDDVLRTAEAMAEATRQARTPTASVQPETPTATEIPVTATASATATPASAVVVANYNSNVRSGPGEVFEVVDFLLEGQQASAQGRFQTENEGVWYFIDREQGLPGWIWGGAVTIGGDPATIPFIESPPTPTPGPSPTDTPAP